LFFEFAKDKQTHKIDRQFMFGGAFLITPVLDQGVQWVRGYFPSSETWYKLSNGEMVNTTVDDPYVDLYTPLSEINVHMRAGHIVPFQFPDLTTTASRKNPFGLLVALEQQSNLSLNHDDSLYASGTLFWDDGESFDLIKTKRYNSFNFMAKDVRILFSFFLVFKTKQIKFIFNFFREVW
jgi:alpha-glucosidase (family GH31 glycosyl hydrolase)